MNKDPGTMQSIFASIPVRFDYPKGNGGNDMEGYKYWGYTNEALVPLAGAGDEDAYKQLFYNLRPIIHIPDCRASS